MADVIISPNMGLPIPITGQDAGPDYANNVNACMTLLDQHSHVAGSGVPITPSAININSDLTFNNSNATALKTARFQAQVSPIAASSPNLTCLYSAGVDLYFNDGSGNQVRITQSGGVAGSPGSISNLTSPASASYSSGTSTFIWQSDVNTPANMDAASYIFRNLTANSKGVTVSAPAALGADYSLTLPLLPSSTKIMTLDSAGNMAAPYVVDNSTIVISGNTIEVPTGGITSTQIANQTITAGNIANGGVQQQNLQAVTSSASPTQGQFGIQNPTGSFSTNSSTFVDVTNCSITITTVGRPVMLGLMPSKADSPSAGYFQNDTTGESQLLIVRGAGNIGCQSIKLAAGERIPACFFFIEVVTAGTYTYKLQAKVNTAITDTFHIVNAVFFCYEL